MMHILPMYRHLHAKARVLAKAILRLPEVRETQTKLAFIGRRIFERPFNAFYDTQVKSYRFLVNSEIVIC